MDKRKVIQKRLECKRCKHMWVSRVEYVRTCPKCRSPYWDAPRILCGGIPKKYKRG